MDLSLDLNAASPTFGDLLRIDGDLVHTSDADPRGTDPVLQNIVQNLRVLEGEWFMDKSQGIPYMQEVLVKNPDLPRIEQYFKAGILNTRGVLQLLEFSLTLQNAIRQLTVKFRVQGTTGIIAYDGPLLSSQGAIA